MKPEKIGEHIPNISAEIHQASVEGSISVAGEGDNGFIRVRITSGNSQKVPLSYTIEGENVRVEVSEVDAIQI